MLLRSIGKTFLVKHISQITFKANDIAAFYDTLHLEILVADIKYLKTQI